MRLLWSGWCHLSGLWDLWAQRSGSLWTDDTYFRGAWLQVVCDLALVRYLCIYLFIYLSFSFSAPSSFFFIILHSVVLVLLTASGAD